MNGPRRAAALITVDTTSELSTTAPVDKVQQRALVAYDAARCWLNTHDRRQATITPLSTFTLPTFLIHFPALNPAQSARTEPEDCTVPQDLGRLA